MRAALEKMAPHELIRYVTIDATAVMSLADNRTQAVEYLLGNHFIAESMFRHDPHALLYARLRVLLYSDAHGDGVFSLDQPSTAFGSMGIAEICASDRDSTTRYLRCSPSSVSKSPSNRLPDEIRLYSASTANRARCWPNSTPWHAPPNSFAPLSESLPEELQHLWHELLMPLKDAAVPGIRVDPQRGVR